MNNWLIFVEGENPKENYVVGSHLSQKEYSYVQKIVLLIKCYFTVYKYSCFIVKILEKVKKSWTEKCKNVMKFSLLKFI